MYFPEDIASCWKEAVEAGGFGPWRAVPARQARAEAAPARGCGCTRDADEDSESGGEEEQLPAASLPAAAARGHAAADDCGRGSPDARQLASGSATQITESALTRQCKSLNAEEEK